MAHPQQRAFCESVKIRFPQYFSNTFALDIGSFDINGNNQFLFDEECIFLGVDVAPGRNVDIVCPASELGLPDGTFDTIVSTECLEHDRKWVDTLRNAIRMLRPGGLLMMTCATTGRPEHGTRRTTPQDAPLLIKVDDDWADYYRNLTENDIRQEINIDAEFQMAEFSVGEATHDLYFFGIKKGVFEARRDRSINLESHPTKIKLGEIKEQLGKVFEEYQNNKKDLSTAIALFVEERAQKEKLSLEIGQIVANGEDWKERAVKLEEELMVLQSTNAQLQGARDAAINELSFVYASKSWSITRPLRAVRSTLGSMFYAGGRVKNGLRYIVRGDFDGFRKRFRYYRADIAVQNASSISTPQKWGVIATQHTLFIAYLIASRLRAHGWQVDVMTTPPSNFDHDMYIVVCPQMFSDLPPGEKRICYQMEQSVSSRWFTEKYFALLESSLAVLEYALANVEFMADKGIAYPHVHYLPVGADTSYAGRHEEVDKAYDVLFYGDAKSSPRRQKMLDVLSRHFKVKICGETFGTKMIEEIRRSRLVINIHYYDNALLEMPRIQECLSLGVPVVSESAQDQDCYPEISGAVAFFEQGDEVGMVEAVRCALNSPGIGTNAREAAALSKKRFDYMFDRFLIAMNFLPSSYVNQVALPLPEKFSAVALSMPETIRRRKVFLDEKPENCVLFDGIRRRPGWIGCGLSYKSVAQHAVRNGIKVLKIMEDDVLLPDDYLHFETVIDEYLMTHLDSWDIFAGVIALLHPETEILAVEEFKGLTFVTINKMTSMVYNIYNEKALRLLAAWDPENENSATNTIDRFLESQENLKIIITLPFFVGHREELHSTLWGFQNTQYNEIIKRSEKRLFNLVSEWRLVEKAGQQA